MTYEKMTGSIDLNELEVQAEEVADISSALLISLNPQYAWVCAFYNQIH